MTHRFSDPVCRELGVDLNELAARSAYMEASHVRGSLDLSAILDRHCGRCHFFIEFGREHPEGECAVNEVMSS